MTEYIYCNLHLIIYCDCVQNAVCIGQHIICTNLSQQITTFHVILESMSRGVTRCHVVYRDNSSKHMPCGLSISSGVWKTLKQVQVPVCFPGISRWFWNFQVLVTSDIKLSTYHCVMSTWVVRENNLLNSQREMYRFNIFSSHTYTSTIFETNCMKIYLEK